MVVGAAVALLALAGCGGSEGGGSGGESFTSTAPTSVPSSTATTAVVTTTEAATTSTTGAPDAARWIGVDWDAGAGGGPPVVDGTAIELSSIAGMCVDGTCDRALDLLTASPTGDAPAPGPYVLWASRLRGRTADGAAQWTITDALDVTLEAGSTTYLCSPMSDPMAQALGFAPGATADGGTVQPSIVWTVDGAGKLATPDPSVADLVGDSDPIKVAV